MATSLLALLDDIATVLDDVAVMTKVAAKKTAGVLGDDLALNAQQVAGVDADRELPVVWAVAKGSLLNKAILVPAALLISAVAAVGGDPADDDRRRCSSASRASRSWRTSSCTRKVEDDAHHAELHRGAGRSAASTWSHSSATRSRARSAPTSSSRPRSS